MQFIAHRGSHSWAGGHRENTLPAIARAIELGFDAVEIDIHATKDGVCVVHHDADIGQLDSSVKELDSPVKIAETEWSELTSLAPYIPKLQSVFDLTAGRIHCYVEIKGDGIYKEVAQEIIAYEDRYEGSRKGERMIKSAATEALQPFASVHSFDHRAIRNIQPLTVSHDISLGILEYSRLVDYKPVLEASTARDLWQWHEFVDEELVREISDLGGRVICWTANDRSRWDYFARIGVYGVCTDLPI